MYLAGKPRSPSWRISWNLFCKLVLLNGEKSISNVSLNKYRIQYPSGRGIAN